MKHGKSVCNTLKQIRLDVARANGIDYVPAPCTHKGDCAGTCPACESEVEYLEKEISRRHSLGKAVLIAGIGLTSLTAMASTSSNTSLASSNGIQSQVCDTTLQNEVFGSSGHMPSFPGGNAALMRFISEHVVYPEEAAKNKIEGKVIVQFIVEKDGSVGEVKVVRGVDKELDAEAVRVCKSLPKFSPGRNAYGEPQRVWYTMPITFKIQESAPEVTE
jgi:TonB family protein